MLPFLYEPLKEGVKSTTHLVNAVIALIARRRSRLSLRRSAAALAAIAFGAGVSLARAPPSLAADRPDEDAGRGDAGAAAPAMGPLIDLAPAPPSGTCLGCAEACSFRHPLCVDAARGTAGPSLLAALAAADRAWDALTGVLGAPAPDGGRGGTWHIELAGGVEGSGDALLGE